MYLTGQIMRHWPLLYAWLQAFRSLGVSPDVALSKGPSALRPRGTMHIFDFLAGRFVADPAGARATRLLAAHFSQYWKILVGLLRC